jgi:hypothetical protein
MSRREVIPMSKSKEAKKKVATAPKVQVKPARVILSWAEGVAQKLRIEQANREQPMRGQEPIHTAPHGTDAIAYEHGVPGTDKLGSADIAMMEMLAPSWDDQWGKMGSSLTGMSIREELAERPLRPFVEGEPIGKIQKHKRGPAKPAFTRDQIMEMRRDEMMALRRKNDRAIARLLERA